MIRTSLRQILSFIKQTAFQIKYVLEAIKKTNANRIVIPPL